MLAGFIGLSLLAIAVTSLFSDDGRQPAKLLALGLAGTLLVAIAWRGIAGVMAQAERELSPEAKPAPSQTTRSGVARADPGLVRRMAGKRETLTSFRA
jgi:hypothetical protein